MESSLKLSIPVDIKNVLIQFFAFYCDEFDIDSGNSSRLKLEDNGDIILLEGTGWHDPPATLFLRHIVTKGKYVWQFKVISRSKDFYIGIYKCKHGAKAGIGDFLHLHGYIFDGGYARLIDGNNYRRDDTYGVRLKKDDIVEMCLDLDALCLSYKINDISYGIAFKDIESCEYKAALSFWFGGDSIQLL